MGNRISFLGTGAGRVVISTQICSTGGFVLNLGKHQIHVDPGPGALMKYRSCNLLVPHTNIICVSHHHVDHVHDAPALIEAITLGGVHKRGYLLSTSDVIEGNSTDVAYIQPRLKSTLNKCFVMAPNDKQNIDEVTITATKAEHDANNLGFIIEYENLKIGYTSDTQYFDGLAEQYMHCDILVCNVLRPGFGSWKTHLSTGDVIKILKKIKPKLCIITGFGAKMINANPLYEAREIVKQTDVRTIAAKDGLVVELTGI